MDVNRARGGHQLPRPVGPGHRAPFPALDIAGAEWGKLVGGPTPWLLGKTGRVAGRTGPHRSLTIGLSVNAYPSSCSLRQRTLRP